MCEQYLMASIPSLSACNPRLSPAALSYLVPTSTYGCWSCSCSLSWQVVVSLSPQRPYLHPGSSPPGWPAGSCGCATGSTWAQADPEPPLPAIPPHSTVPSARSPARIPERTRADSHAEGRGQTMNHAFPRSIPKGVKSTPKQKPMQQCITIQIHMSVSSKMSQTIFLHYFCSCFS